jgi:uncharacterized protein
MVSKTKMLELVKSFRADDVARGLDESPDLRKYGDQRGRNFLHICCGVNPRGDRRKVAASVKTAEVLLNRGLGLDDAAFTEENDWKATPLWFAIARGENLVLADFLLKRGANPNYCLWAAGFRENIEAIRMLIGAGADVNDPSVDESPLLGAVKWGNFKAAAELLKHGADPNYRDRHGMTALHYMLKKSRDKKHFAMFIASGARGDIPNNSGETAAALMRRKKDPDFQKMADQLRESRDTS